MAISTAVLNLLSYSCMMTHNLGKKGVKNFVLSFPQNAYHVDLVPLWPLPSPHPDHSWLVGVRKDQAGVQHRFFGEGGEEEEHL